MLGGPRRRLVRSAATSVVASAALCTALLTATAPSAAAAINHTGLVPSTPSRGYPVINVTPLLADGSKRAVFATNQIGSYLVSGGNFQKVTLKDGTVVSQPYLTAAHVDTKAIACKGLVADDEVLAVIPSATTDVGYIAGRFNKLTTPSGTVIRRSHVAKVNFATCTVDPTFVPAAVAGKVQSLALLGNRLFIGGDFDSVGGVANGTITELNATTAALQPNFKVTRTGTLTSRIKTMAVNPAGTRLIVAGRFGTLTAGGKSAASMTAVINIAGTTPVITAHTSTGYLTTKGVAMPLDNLTNAAVSPDGTLIGLTFGLASAADYVYVTPTTEVAATKYKWRHYMRDSSFGIAFSNKAVYVGGHFCKPDGGPGTAAVMAPVGGITTDCTGTTLTGGVWRSKIAALSLTDGTPLTWNPGNASFKGATALTVTPRGLLVGYDGERTATMLVGSLAFFDFNAV